MAEEDIIEEEVPIEEEEEEAPTERPLTLDESFKPILDVKGQQAAGQVDLGEGKYTPSEQEVQDDELLTDADEYIASVPEITAAQASQVTDVDAPRRKSFPRPWFQQDSQVTDVAAPSFEDKDSLTISSPSFEDKASLVDSVERSFTKLSAQPDPEAAKVARSDGSVIDPEQVVDERSKAEMLERGSLAEAKTQDLAQEATVKYQIEQLYASLEEGKPIPAWAAPNLRKVDAIMASRGLGKSSVASAAMVQAIAESALPIAAADAQSHSRIQLQNLNNQQQTALSNAATIAAMDSKNLDNRMRAAQQNANSFLQMDLKDADYEQQANLLDYQSNVQSLFTDAAAENARLQFNAKTETQVNEFYDQLGTTVANNNANREAAMNQFNVDQTNSVRKYSAKLKNEREKFNATMRLQIDQSNALWRRNINTANTAELNNANKINAAAILGISTAAQNDLWQQYRDEASFAFTSTENEKQRTQQLILTALTQQFERELFDAEIDFKSSASIANYMSSALETTFKTISESIADDLFGTDEEEDLLQNQVDSIGLA
tara:strand:+ start:576 stop:2222 length:1647 start_codon:yes stop_codon:yes gene_type:complete